MSEHYVIKSFNKLKDRPNFYFLRWMADIHKDKKVTDYVCQMIAKYITSKEHKLPFLDVFVVDDNVFIYTPYPGKWIGKKGTDVDELQNTLNHNAKGEETHQFKVRIIEPTKTNYNAVMGHIRGYHKKEKK